MATAPSRCGLMCDQAPPRDPVHNKITRGLSPPRQKAGLGRGYPPANPVFKSYAAQKAEREQMQSRGMATDPGPWASRTETAGRETKFNPPQGKKMVNTGNTAQQSSNRNTACFYYGAPPPKGRAHALKQVDMKGSGGDNVVRPNVDKSLFDSEYMVHFPKDTSLEKAKAHQQKQPAFGKVPAGGFIKWDRHDAHNCDEIPVKDEKFYQITGGSGQAQYGHYFVHKERTEGANKAHQARAIEGDPENARAVRKPVDFSEHPALGTAVQRRHMTTLDFAKFPGQNEWRDQKPVRKVTAKGEDIKVKNTVSQIEWDMHG